jgi:ribosome-binding factor A
MTRRLLKAAEAIRSVVSMAILTELRDPRVKHVTVVGVEVLPDMKSAKVFVSIMGSEKEQRLALAGLQHAAGFLQRKIAERIETRYTPRLTFVLDKGVKNSLQVARILKQVLPPPPSAEPTESEEADEPAEMAAPQSEALEPEPPAGHPPAPPPREKQAEALGHALGASPNRASGDEAAPAVAAPRDPPQGPPPVQAAARAQIEAPGRGTPPNPLR